jgi:hypothetical protein
MKDARERLRTSDQYVGLGPSETKLSDKESNPGRREGGSTRSQDPHNPKERQGVEFQKERQR